MAYHFDSYEALAQHPDCKYAYDVHGEISNLTRRVESLNLVGDMLWPVPLPDFTTFPMSRYEWLTVSADVFLMRFISVVDCAMLVINEVFECKLDASKCSIGNLRKSEVPNSVTDLLGAMMVAQGSLRPERNRRFHHGAERGFTQDDMIFRTAALMEHRGGVAGTDSFGRPLNMERSFREGLVELQKEFNAASRKLVRQLNNLYDLLEPEFERRFAPRFKAGPFARSPEVTASE
ncbi:Cthe_2314 family HEPN domain-containing protein [Brevundimonas sp. Root1279]|uniref:Cthe_2314 family HEPN domain-containing protein n=1 Tax=Brevundimonas sp. Root1279 TaxID=1736443 RepID=UPI00191094F5|nr:Cthe_2314 family HEPN domain-containing protein [Brevundimonas sp. Root1279]